eukprot:GEMP01022362.1.p1 GENE.GEMP01022362.1~~GEMP01022362.1.p1  ORF type:complete len:397 (+),score=92.79 GEMP01022362.1:56-1192(+)
MEFERGRSLMKRTYSAFTDVCGDQLHSRMATPGMKGLAYSLSAPLVEGKNATRGLYVAIAEGKAKTHSLGAVQIIAENKNSADTVNASQITSPPTRTLPNGKQSEEAFWRAECVRLKEELQRERAESTRVAMLYIKAEDARKVLEVQLQDMQAVMEDTTSVPPSNTPLGAWTQGQSYVLAGGRGKIGAIFDDAMSQVASPEFVSPIESRSSTPCVPTPKAPTPRVPTPRTASPVLPSPRTRSVHRTSRHEYSYSPLLQLSVSELRALAHAVMNPARNTDAYSVRPPSSRTSLKKFLTPMESGYSDMTTASMLSSSWSDKIADIEKMWRSQALRFDMPRIASARFHNSPRASRMREQVSSRSATQSVGMASSITICEWE